MSKIQLLDQLLGQYKLWTVKLSSSSKAIENNILQKGSGKNIEEKLMSIGIASIMVYIGTGVLSLFGVFTGGFLIGIIFFGLGLLLSKYINKKIFGVERKVEHLKEEEALIFDKLEEIKTIHHEIRKKVNEGIVLVNFTDYVTLSKQFQDVVNLLQNYNTNHLAYKFKLNHKIVTTKYKNQVKKFDAIYAHKN